MPHSQVISQAGRWFLHSGLQEPSGGVARYYRSDIQKNQRVSTEITGYAASTFIYLHSITGDPAYLERARCAARFLTRSAWDPALQVFPFEYAETGEPPEPLAYFFDSGIIARGLLSVWRSTGEREFLDTATICARGMRNDFNFNPILGLPGKEPLAHDDRWSRSPGCYQLKAALAWQELFEETGDRDCRAAYRESLEAALRSNAGFLPGHPDPAKVMDRLHAYCYFLEGLLACIKEPACAAAAQVGVDRVARLLREIAPAFERSDVYAQLLRMRLFVALTGAGPVDRDAAEWEARRLAQFQIQPPGSGANADPRVTGGFCFGGKNGELLPQVSPVATAFAIQALAMWNAYRAGELTLCWKMLI